MPPASPASGAEPFAPATAARQWTLVYDGDCRFCRQCVAILDAWDRRGRLGFAPFQTEDALAALPPIPREALEQAMHLVGPDDAVLAGAAAAPAILRLLPGGRAVAWLFAVPGVPWLAARVYRAVARNRHRLGCGSSACTRGR